MPSPPKGVPLKISPGMIEAGIAAMARGRKLSEVALLTQVYSAMDAVRRREDSKAPGAAPEYVHQDWPAVRYGPNGARIVCHKPEDVPEGWADSPDRAPTFVEAAKVLGVETVADLTESLSTLREAYKAKFGKRAGPTWDAPKLREMLADG